MKKFFVLASISAAVILVVSVAAAIAEEKEHKHEDVDKATAQSAGQEERIEISNDTELHVLTPEVPQGAIDYARERKGAILESERHRDLSTVDIGAPYAVQCIENLIKHDAKERMYRFPVIDKDEIIGVLRVFYDQNREKWGGIYSQIIVDNLQQYAGKTSPEDPVEFYFYESNQLGIQDEAVELIAENPLEEFTMHSEFKNYHEEIVESKEYKQFKEENLEVVDIMQPQSWGIDSTDIALMDTAPNEEILELDTVEAQDDKSWCAAYAAAHILRYKLHRADSSSEFDEDEPKGRDIVEHSGYCYYSDHEDVNLSWSQIQEYTTDVADLPEPTLYPDPLDFDEVKEQIDEQNPVYFSGERIESDEKGRHAVTIKGYREGSDAAYYVRNPWYGDDEDMTEEFCPDTNIYYTEYSLIEGYEWDGGIKDFDCDSGGWWPW